MTIINFKHQETIFQRFKDEAYWALFLEPGTGKSRITIKLLERNYTKGEIRAALILVPKTILATWAHLELPKHSDLSFKVYVWNGSITQKSTKAFNQVLKYEGMTYLIANHDAISTPRFQDLLNRFWQTKKKVAVIIDESTAIKSMKAARTKMALKIGRVAKLRGILTGTPMLESPLDIYAQTEFLAPKTSILGHLSFYSFKTRYAVLKRLTFGFRSFDTIVGYRDLPELRKKLDKFSAFIKLEDIVDMPPQIFKTVLVEMTPEQDRVYTELKEKAVAYIKNHEVTAINALSLLVKLHQICCGQLKTQDGQYIAIENNRLQTLKDQMDEVDHKVLIWCNYVNASANIATFLGKDAILLSADQSAKQREETINTWRTGTMKGLILNPASAGHGLTLVEAKTVIFYSNSFKAELREQALRRNYRLGQNAHTVVIDLMIKGTVEEKIMAALQNKKNISDLITNAKDLLEFIE